MRWRAGVTAALVVVLLSGCSRPQEPIARAAEYLWKQQSADGAWHSHTYGLLRSGQALTPFVLDALLAIPEKASPRPHTKVDRALAFVQNNIRNGALGMADPSIPDYPNYATALALSAFCRARQPGWENRVQPLVSYLRSQQFTGLNGWYRDHPVYGAWGMGGGRRTPPDTGHVDLSMTRYVLQALRASGVPPSDPLFRQARVFVERCQNFDPQHPNDADGGFFFSTTEFDTNKAGPDGQHFRSYGTTTADGILSLLAIGSRADDERLVAARRWLTTHHHAMEVPGFVGEAYQRWPRGLAFYYAAASTQAFQALRVDAGDVVSDRLRRIQRADGSWSNPENLVKEDDPLIATVFAIRALMR
jgi:squalene-hopene/tetraprenyl-beta-curcumene cyclase